MTYDLDAVLAVYAGSSGDDTKALYAALEKLGVPGVVAMNLFRACKASERAKEYRGRYKRAAYEKKQWSIDNLCTALLARPVEGISFGWAIDERMRASGAPHFNVLYVDTWFGQISFHSDTRGAGPDYGGQWDGMKGVATGRVCRLVAVLFQVKKTIVEPIIEQVAREVVKSVISEAYQLALPLQRDDFKDGEAQ